MAQQIVFMCILTLVLGSVLSKKYSGYVKDFGKQTKMSQLASFIFSCLFNTPKKHW